jgi:hypothetical protein
MFLGPVNNILAVRVTKRPWKADRFLDEVATELVFKKAPSRT